MYFPNQSGGPLARMKKIQFYKIIKMADIELNVRYYGAFLDYKDDNSRPHWRKIMMEIPNNFYKMHSGIAEIMTVTLKGMTRIPWR